MKSLYSCTSLPDGCHLGSSFQLKCCSQSPPKNDYFPLFYFIISWVVKLRQTERGPFKWQLASLYKCFIKLPHKNSDLFLFLQKTRHAISCWATGGLKYALKWSRETLCVCVWLSVGNRVVILQYRGCGELCNALLLPYILLKMH